MMTMQETLPWRRLIPALSLLIMNSRHVACSCNIRWMDSWDSCTVFTGAMRVGAGSSTLLFTGQRNKWSAIFFGRGNYQSFVGINLIFQPSIYSVILISAMQQKRGSPLSVGFFWHFIWSRTMPFWEVVRRKWTKQSMLKEMPERNTWIILRHVKNSVFSRFFRLKVTQISDWWKEKNPFLLLIHCKEGKNRKDQEIDVWSKLHGKVFIECDLYYKIFNPWWHYG